MDIIVTTPKKEINNAAKEAKEALDGKVTHYFRTFRKFPTKLNKGDKVFYIEDGYIRGYAVVDSIENQSPSDLVCLTTERKWIGNRIHMRCDSWIWIEPIKYKGFQGFKYIQSVGINEDWAIEKGVCMRINYTKIGDWKAQKPKIN